MGTVCCITKEREVANAARLFNIFNVPSGEPCGILCLPAAEPGGPIRTEMIYTLVSVRANPPVRPHNFLGILKEYKFRPPLNFTVHREDQQGY